MLVSSQEFYDQVVNNHSLRCSKDHQLIGEVTEPLGVSPNGVQRTKWTRFQKSNMDWKSFRQILGRQQRWDGVRRIVQKEGWYEGVRSELFIGPEIIQYKGHYKINKQKYK